MLLEAEEAVQPVGARPITAVTIAKDVLEQLRLKEIVAESGTYVRYRYMSHQCMCCAIGSLFLQVYTGSHLGNPWERSRKDFTDPLRRYFSESQLELIESCFERYLAKKGYPIDEAAARRAYDFGTTYEDPHARLVAIMENIIANDGVFVP